MPDQLEVLMNVGMIHLCRYADNPSRHRRGRWRNSNSTFAVGGSEAWSGNPDHAPISYSRGRRISLVSALGPTSGASRGERWWDWSLHSVPDKAPEVFSLPPSPLLSVLLFSLFPHRAPLDLSGSSSFLFSVMFNSSSANRSATMPSRPIHVLPASDHFHNLCGVIQSGQKIVAITGAGLSTATGIPVRDPWC